ncbi:helix-turn-helix domain-containing protein [Streptomyces sp. NPDC057592]|uniref:helix-turn-helix domain-containing protein n=1 Tax=unclassified Streptomyces TaxID=2593676 RepID=UPI0036926284
MQAAELFEQEVKPPEVARRLWVSLRSACQWHQLWREGGVGALASRGRVGRGVGCLRAAWRSSPCIWSRVRPRTAGWRTRCGPPRGWPC